MYNSFTISNLYKQYYTEESLKTIITISDAILGVFAGLLGIILIHVALILYGSSFKYYTSTLLAIGEIISLLLFGIYIIYFSFLPPLMNNEELHCVIYK